MDNFAGLVSLQDSAGDSVGMSGCSASVDG